MNTLIVSSLDCSFKHFYKLVTDFLENEGHKYAEEYELIKINENRSHLILEVKDLKGFSAAVSNQEMKNWDKGNSYKDIFYSLTPID